MLDTAHHNEYSRQVLKASYKNINDQYFINVYFMQFINIWYKIHYMI